MLIESVPGRDGVVIGVLAASRIDSASADAFRAEFCALAQGHQGVVLDLQRTSFIDSIGLGALLFATRRVAKSGGTLVLCGLQTNVRALLALVRMDRLMCIAGDREEAIARLTNGLSR